MDVETCAVLYGRVSETIEGLRIFITRMEFAPPAAYAERSPVSATLTPEYVFEVTSGARQDDLVCIFAHSHPADHQLPSFSRVDDQGERRLADFLAARLPSRPHAAMVVSPGGLRARIIGCGPEIRVRQVGKELVTLFDPRAPELVMPWHDRQIRAFGKLGQLAISRLRVAIVGLGGTGSIICQQLTYLGIRDFILVDFDTVDETSLNRLVGAVPADVGALKVDVARRGIQSVFDGASVKAIAGDVADDHVARQLIGADIVFSCTDSHASRAVIGQIAYQYLIPTIDMGVSISVRLGQLAFITGRVQLLAPGLPCLACMDQLDSEQIRREMMTPEQRKADPYITGVREPQPSVISLNSTVSSLAITMFLGVVASAPVKSRAQIYDGINGSVRNITANVDAECFVCSVSGALAKGDSLPLPTRPVQHRSVVGGANSSALG
jgi:molybdopterin/thiamine biosynthesis adenylyltransferase